MTLNKQIHLDNRPQGEASLSNFKLVNAQLPALQDGQVLIKHAYLSLDPYMRGRMNDTKSYVAPQELGQTMGGGAAGEVIESKSLKYAVGDKVVGMGGWQEYSIVDASQTGTWRKVNTSRIPLSAYLGSVGMPGVTAWYGLMKICDPKVGETVVVSAASGAVGSVVGQLAKARGCRAVGIAGGAEKCAYVVNELGFDACVDYKAHPDPRSLYHAIKDVTPEGVDGYFENVGGVILDAVLSRMNAFGRIAVCGMIAGYEGNPLPLLEPQLILTNRLSMRGFIVSEQMEHWPTALTELGVCAAEGFEAR